MTGFAHIHGIPVGILGNNAIRKARSRPPISLNCAANDASRSCSSKIVGFMVGRDYAAGGIVKDGADDDRGGLRAGAEDHRDHRRGRHHTSMTPRVAAARPNTVTDEMCSCNKSHATSADAPGTRKKPEAARAAP